MEISDHERRRRLKAWYLACAHVDSLRHWIAHDEADAERIFNAFAEGGVVIMPFGPTFWAKKFGMVTDKYGTPWMVNCGMAD